MSVVFLYQDIKRIAQSLLKAMKSPAPDMELRPGQQVDINTLLSLLEDIIRLQTANMHRLQNWAAGDFYTDEIKKHHSKTASLHLVNLQGNQAEVLDIWLSGFLQAHQQFDWPDHLIVLTAFDKLGVTKSLMLI